MAVSLDIAQSPTSSFNLSLDGFADSCGLIVSLGAASALSRESSSDASTSADAESLIPFLGE